MADTSAKAMSYWTEVSNPDKTIVDLSYFVGSMMIGVVNSLESDSLQGILWTGQCLTWQALLQ